MPKLYNNKLVLALICAAVAFGGKLDGCSFPDILNPVTTEIGNVAVIYEKQKMSMPDFVYDARKTWNEKYPNKLFMILDVNEASKSGKLGKAAVAKAEEVGLPTLLPLTAEYEVIEAVPLPTNELAILEVLK